jgi:hypothetical protein
LATCAVVAESEAVLSDLVGTSLCASVKHPSDRIMHRGDACAQQTNKQANGSERCNVVRLCVMRRTCDAN